MTDKLLQEKEIAFVGICNNVLLEKSAYINKYSRLKHNKAHKNLNQIVTEICKYPDFGNRFFSDLMSSDDTKVRLISAGYALSNNVCPELALETLKKLNSDADPNVVFHASMSIYVWEQKTMGGGDQGCQGDGSLIDV